MVRAKVNVSVGSVLYDVDLSDGWVSIQRDGEYLGEYPWSNGRLDDYPDEVSDLACSLIENRLSMVEFAAANGVLSMAVES